MHEQHIKACECKAQSAQDAQGLSPACPMRSTVVQDLTALVVAGTPADLECCLASETTSGAACCSASSCTGALVSAALTVVEARTQAGPRDCLSCSRTNDVCGNDVRCDSLII